jgi:hypothetical protein
MSRKRVFEVEIKWRTRVVILEFNGHDEDIELRAKHAATEALEVELEENPDTLCCGRYDVTEII